MSDTPDGLHKAFLKLLHSVGLHPFSRILRQDAAEGPSPLEAALERLGPSGSTGENEPPKEGGR